MKLDQLHTLEALIMLYQPDQLHTLEALMMLDQPHILKRYKKKKHARQIV